MTNERNQNQNPKRRPLDIKIGDLISYPIPYIRFDSSIHLSSDHHISIRPRNRAFRLCNSSHRTPALSTNTRLLTLQHLLARANAEHTPQPTPLHKGSKAR
ncbi:hypothetical protein M422DRAFT_780356 [Sphaerobolus stellatus SS14]|uniref:Uncharacterized protein n=1 Tax=Sphaerobolus stellatus (strain SS14) TaxID=990650 RepID=A0A0C9UDP8_SPHS4|nr:hypothetical protein M422DRAFT_780356 [Sphaerobolus stellatus SS14]